MTSKIKPKTDIRDLRVMNRKMIYSIGIPIELSEEQLKSNQYFGLYGTIRTIVLVKGNKFQNSSSVYITYDNQIEAAMAILGTSEQSLERGNIKTIFGTVKYCLYFLKKIQCKNLPNCPYLHIYDKKNEIYIKDSVFQVYQQHQEAAKDIILQKQAKNYRWKSNERSKFKQPNHIINELFPQNQQVSNRIIELLFKQCKKTRSSKYLKNHNSLPCLTTKCKLEQIVEKQLKELNFTSKQTE